MLSRLYCQYPEYECIGNSTSSQGLDEQMLRAELILEVHVYGRKKYK